MHSFLLHHIVVATGRTIVRAGMEDWLRQGPNKRMTPSRRIKCHQTRYPDPKPSTVHQTGAIPGCLLNRSFRKVRRHRPTGSSRRRRTAAARAKTETYVVTPKDICQSRASAGLLTRTMRLGPAPPCRVCAEGAQPTAQYSRPV